MYIVDVVICKLWMQFYVRRYMYIVAVVICTLWMQFYVHCGCSFMYIVNVVLCTLLMLLSKNFFFFLAKVNINVDTAFQVNNRWEKCGVEGQGVGGVRGNLKEVRRATISVDVSNLLRFDVNHLFPAIFLSVDANISWTPKSVSTLIFRGCRR